MQVEISKHNCICKERNNMCIISSSNKQFSVFGKARTNYVLLNPNQNNVSKYIVDQCLLVNFGKEEKCDYLFKVDNENLKEVYFVECKGSDVRKAVSQIDSSINILKNELTGFTIKGRIITTKTYTPDLKSLEYKKLTKRLNGQLVTKNINLTESI